ncbi:MAG TPA: hypothetical protein DCK85_05940, partial [Ktedonobacter sp.]|nr:hypothetical protein [Ktedonobacter sp.]
MIKAATTMIIFERKTLCQIVTKRFIMLFLDGLQWSRTGRKTNFSAPTHTGSGKNCTSQRMRVRD